jgi:hypothetical protein
MAQANERLYSTFERYEEFKAAQEKLLTVDLFADPSKQEEQAEALILIRPLTSIVSNERVFR